MLSHEPPVNKSVQYIKMISVRSTYKDYTDEKLMECLARKDEEAFDELYDRYSGNLLRYFYRMLYQDEEKAQDFLQDLFVKLVEKPHLFDSRRKFSSWIYSIAANMCKNEYRKQEVRKVLSNVEDTSLLSGSEISSEDRLDRDMFADCLTTEVDKLSESHREVFILRYQEELSIKEISKIMNCSEGTIKSRIFMHCENYPAICKLLIRKSAKS